MAALVAGKVPQFISTTRISHVLCSLCCAGHCRFYPRHRTVPWYPDLPMITSERFCPHCASAPQHALSVVPDRNTIGFDILDMAFESDAVLPKLALRGWLAGTRSAS